MASELEATNNDDDDGDHDAQFRNRRGVTRKFAIEPPTTREASGEEEETDKDGDTDEKNGIGGQINGLTVVGRFQGSIAVGGALQLVIDESKARAEGASQVKQSGLLDPLAVSASNSTSSSSSRPEARLRRRAAAAHNREQQQQQLLMEHQRQAAFSGDSVEFILWYHSNESTKSQPIYSVDARHQMTPMFQSIQPHLPTSPTTQNPNQQQQQASSLVPVLWRQQVRQKYGGSSSSLGSSGRQDSLDDDDDDDNGTGANHRQQQQQQQIDGSFQFPIEPSEGLELNYSSSIASAPASSNHKAPSIQVEQANYILRNVISGNAKHYAQAKLSSRVRMLIRGTRAHLIIDKLEPSDSGQYKCRVDFRLARTRYQWSQLDVIGEWASIHWTSNSIAWAREREISS